MKSSKVLAVAALCVATGLAGCGGDDTPKATSTSPAGVATPTPTPPSPADAANATPTQKWAKATCDKLASGMTALQPPEIQGTSPEATKASLVTFFGQLSDQLGKQATILGEVGPPPGPNAQREYKKALAKLDVVQGKLDKVVGRVKASDAGTKKEVDSLVVDLGESLKVMASYDGPIAQLTTTRSLGAALSAEPGCSSLGVGGQPTS
jgi:hypothetical protein